VQKKKITTSTTAHQNSNKTKESSSTGKLSRKDFCAVWNCYGGPVFSSPDKTSRPAVKGRHCCKNRLCSETCGNSECVLATDTRRDISLKLCLRSRLPNTLIPREATQNSSYKTLSLFLPFTIFNVTANCM
jgi:hypothetical protein